jgi:hypothetical protein
MTDMARDIHGLRVLICANDGPTLSNERDGDAFMSAAWEQNANLVAIPISRLADEFFRLDTRVAGEVIQKFVNYHLRLAVIGDISTWTTVSAALRDFVYEANHGQTVWFVKDIEELDRLLLSQRS